MIDLFITDISLNVYACVYFLLYVASYIVYSRKIGSFKNINATQFLILYFCVASLLSLIYLNISNGLFRDYSNLSLPPYLYLFVCFCISLVPIYKYAPVRDKEIVYKKVGSLINILYLYR